MYVQSSAELLCGCNNEKQNVSVAPRAIISDTTNWKTALRALPVFVSWAGCRRTRLMTAMTPRARVGVWTQHDVRIERIKTFIQRTPGRYFLPRSAMRRASFGLVAAIHQLPFPGIPWPIRFITRASYRVAVEIQEKECR